VDAVPWTTQNPKSPKTRSSGQWSLLKKGVPFSKLQLWGTVRVCNKPAASAITKFKLHLESQVRDIYIGGEGGVFWKNRAPRSVDRELLLLR
jgi:hypothetical protein